MKKHRKRHLEDVHFHYHFMPMMAMDPSMVDPMMMDPRMMPPYMCPMPNPMHTWDNFDGSHFGNPHLGVRAGAFIGFPFFFRRRFFPFTFFPFFFFPFDFF